MNVADAGVALAHGLPGAGHLVEALFQLLDHRRLPRPPIPQQGDGHGQRLIGGGQHIGQGIDQRFTPQIIDVRGFVRLGGDDPLAQLAAVQAAGRRLGSRSRLRSGGGLLRRSRRFGRLEKAGIA